ncbi:MAG: hypothetical protein JWR42_645 [Marmoricola sp.]|nr:hypothetical protein [Marmoricola sp.]
MGATVVWAAVVWAAVVEAAVVEAAVVGAAVVGRVEPLTAPPRVLVERDLRTGGRPLTGGTRIPRQHVSVCVSV